MHRLADAPSDMLFGLIALHNDLIAPGVISAALRSRTLDPDRTLAEVLVDQGALSPRQRELVESLSREYIQRHGGDAGKCLATLVAAPSTRERLDRLGDPELSYTLASGVPLGSTVTYESGRANGRGTVQADDGPRFRIVRSHARGGIGEVFVALDAELNREVALKRIQDRHADDPASRARFLQEAEVTGKLEHPGIVPVYGLGRDPDGRPYYAMRFIRGDSLKEAIAAFHTGDGPPGTDPGARSLGLRQLLRRFVDICNAVEYAHRRGVLHRDLKPGNVLVGPYGETLVVDWGLAKATGQAETDPAGRERTLRISVADGGSSETLPGSVLGTPAYMSPEQAAGELDRLGPRSDVYSLGATLYCLVTGRPPFPEGDLDDVLRAVRGSEFATPRQVDRTIDPALEAVCLKAMAMLPEDRYPSPKALAEDVERWMADEPVGAWREPFSRRARRWARRNRTAVAASVVALVVGVVGLGAMAGVQARANGQLLDANAATSRALAETKLAQAQTQAALAQSEESRKQAEAVSQFLVEAFRSPAPTQDGRQVKLADVLDRAATRLDKEFAGSRATQGALLDTLGTTYWGLGLYDRAVSLHTRARAVLETALGPDHPDTLKTRSNLAIAYRSAGRLPESIALDEETLKLREAVLGPDHPQTLASRNNLGNAYYRAGRLSESIALHEGTLKLKEAKLGPDHLDTLKTRNNLAIAYRDAGRLSEALALDQGTLALRQAKLGPDHPDTLNSRNNLALAYRDAGRLSEAIALDKGTLALRETKLGPNHPDTLISRNNLALGYFTAGRLPEAIALNETTLELREAKLGPGHPDTLESRHNLAAIYESVGRWTEAERLYRDILARRRKAVKPSSPILGEDLAELGRVLLVQSRWSEAEPLLRECLAIREKAMPDAWRRYEVLGLLGTALLGQGRYVEAEPLLVAGWQGMKARESAVPVPDRYRILTAAERVVRLYEEWNQPDQVVIWKAKLGMADLPDDVFARP